MMDEDPTPAPAPAQDTVQQSERSKEKDRAYYSNRKEDFERAVEQCHQLLKPDEEGFEKVWRVLSVNHRGFEQDRILLLTTNRVIRVKYDYFSQKILKSEDTKLSDVKKVQCGPIEFPKSSWAPTFGDIAAWRRNVSAVRVYTDLSTPSGWVQWGLEGLGMTNARDSRYRTYVFPYDRPEQADSEGQEFLQDIADSIIQIRSKAIEGADSLQVDTNPVYMDSWVGLASLVYNSSHLGRYKERNGVSF